MVRQRRKEDLKPALGNEDPNDPAETPNGAGASFGNDPVWLIENGRLAQPFKKLPE